MNDYHSQYERVQSERSRKKAELIHGTKTAKQTGPVFFIKATKHDNHSFELKTAIEYYKGQKFIINTQAYLFLPKSAHLDSWSTDTLRKDFTSHIRLSVPFYSDNGKSVLEDARAVLEKEIVLLRNGEPSSKLNEACRNLAAIFNEILKNYLSDHKKKITDTVLQKNLLSQQAQLVSLHSSILDFNKTIAFARPNVGLNSSAETKPSILSFLDEYISNLFIHYIGGVTSTLEKNIGRIDAKIEAQEILATLEKLGAEEAQWRQNNLNKIAFEAELQPQRMSYLKKFFQSSLFFDVVAKEGIKTFSEPAAIAGATIAAASAYFVETASSMKSVHFAAGSSVILSIGVFMYVLKDRMKDWLRNTMLDRVRVIMPDIEHRLFAKKRYIGKSRSWLRKLTSDKLPSEAIQARHNACIDQLESTLSEDVLLFKTSLEVNGLGLTDNEIVTAIRESTRVNIERYLKYFDDPYKQYFFLNNDGKMTLKNSHRTYQFYLFVNSKHTLLGSREKNQTNQATYRITLDKTGIVDISLCSKF